MKKCYGHIYWALFRLIYYWPAATSFWQLLRTFRAQGACQEPTLLAKRPTETSIQKYESKGCTSHRPNLWFGPHLALYMLLYIYIYIHVYALIAAEIPNVFLAVQICFLLGPFLHALVRHTVATSSKVCFVTLERFRWQRFRALCDV